MSKANQSNKGKKKPKFVRCKGQHMNRLGDKWRKPRGIDSKMRGSVFGKQKMPKVGYGGDSSYRGLHPSGYEEVTVHRPKDLNDMDPSVQAARVSGKVGLQKKERILAKADELGIKILNR